MKQVEIEANLWAAGVGPKPAGVLIDTERSLRRAPRLAMKPGKHP